MEDTQRKNDHDLLIEVVTEVRGMREDFKNMANNLNSRISALESDKQARADSEKRYIASDAIHRDHENRIRILEDKNTTMSTQWKMWGTIVTVGMMVLSVVLKFIHIGN